MSRGLPIYSSSFPEGATILSVESDTIFKINKTAPSLVNGISMKLGELNSAFVQANRAFGFDGHDLRNEYTDTILFKNNKFYNCYSGVSSGLQSLGVDVFAVCDIDGNTATIKSVTYTLQGVTYSTEDIDEMLVYVYANRKIFGTGIPDNTSVTAVDYGTGVLTLNKQCSAGSDILCEIDSNTINYRTKNVSIEANDFIGLLNSAMSWSTPTIDTDTQNIQFINNYIGDWYGSLRDCVTFVGVSGAPTLFKGIICSGNYIGNNLEGDNNGAIAFNNVDVACVGSNNIVSYGNRGEIITRNIVTLGSCSSLPTVASVLTINGTIS
jgi:hypothetical protein